MEGESSFSMFCHSSTSVESEVVGFFMIMNSQCVCVGHDIAPGIIKTMIGSSKHLSVLVLKITE